MVRSIAENPFGERMRMNQELLVYVHVPFCSSKCHFCYWTSPIPAAELVRNKAYSAQYRDAVLRQIRSVGTRGSLSSRPVRLIYFGGGTPSLLEVSDLEAILSEIHGAFRFTDSFRDTTIEISPETVDLERLCGLRAAGFTRISFGFQSLHPERLRKLGRAHSIGQALQAFENGRAAGFDNINIDLMLGFPGETQEEFDESFQQTLALSPDHISLYIYRPVPNTVMARQIDSGITVATPPEVAANRYLEARKRLADMGYREYIFQLFSKNGKRCFCDQSYFHVDVDHIGFGAGAHSLLNGKVMGHSPDLSSYLESPRFDYEFPASSAPNLIQAKLFEMLHTDDGINLARVQERFGMSFSDMLSRHEEIAAFYSDIREHGVDQDALGNLAFVDRDSRAMWLANPPKQYKSSKVPMQASENLVQIHG